MDSGVADQQAVVKQEERSCDGCNLSLPAQSWCYQCAQALCLQCYQAHGNLKCYSNHIVVLLSEVTEEEMRKYPKEERCERHRKKLKFYCQNCVVPACSTCAILHHSGHKMTEMEAVLEEKKMEVLSWCQKVETALPAFQAREASSHVKLQRLDNALQAKVQHVETLFADITSKVKDRERQVVADLRKKVKGQMKVLEEQHRQDQEAVVSARAMVEEGKRVASLGLPTQVIGLPKNMEKQYRTWQASEEAAVEPLSDLRINEGDPAALMIILEKIGEVVELPFSCSEFKLDRAHNPRLTLHTDGCTLSNDAGSTDEVDLTSDQLNGVITTAAAPETTCYWQVHYMVTPLDHMRDGWFCEIGICDLESLGVNDTWHISGSSSGSSTLILAKDGGSAIFRPYIESTTFPDFRLSDWPQDTPLDCTVGFLLDRSKHRLHVIDVNKAELLFSTEVNMDKPLWPVLCVCPKGKIRADVRLMLQSGAKMSMSSDIVNLLTSLLDGSYRQLAV